MKHLGDVTKIKGCDVENVDIIVGGSPCQDLSVAGLRRGVQHKEHGDDETTRSGLAYEMFRIIKEMRDEADRRAVKPVRYALWENVPGTLSAKASDGGKGTAFQCVITEFIRVKDQEAPPVPIPKDGWPTSGCIIFGDGHSSIAWRIRDLQFWGAPQRRRRLAVLCDYDGLSAPSILFEQHTGNWRSRQISAVEESIVRNQGKGKQEE